MKVLWKFAAGLMIVLAIAIHAKAASFVEDCDTWNSSMWSNESEAVDLGTVDGRTVWIYDFSTKSRINPVSQNRYGYGTYKITFKMPPRAGVGYGIFGYNAPHGDQTEDIANRRPPDFNEVDFIEVLEPGNDHASDFEFTFYRNGEENWCGMDELGLHTWIYSYTWLNGVHTDEHTYDAVFPNYVNWEDNNWHTMEIQYSSASVHMLLDGTAFFHHDEGQANGTAVQSIPPLYFFPLGGSRCDGTASVVFYVDRIEFIEAPVQPHPPVLAEIGSDETIHTGVETKIVLSATDPDSSDTLTYSVTTAPSGTLPDNASFDPAAKTFSWTPAADQCGACNLRFMVSDGTLCDYQDIAFFVRDDTGVPADVVGWWKCDEGNGLSLLDSSGKFNRGSMRNMTPWHFTQGKSRTALHMGWDPYWKDYRPNGEYIVVPDSAPLHIPGDQMTAALWLKRAANSNDNEGILSKWDQAALKGFSLDSMADGTVCFTAGNGSSSGTVSTPLTNDEWTHLAVTYDNETMKMYKNGMFVSSAALSGGGYSTSDLQIGRRNSGASGYFHGDLDEMKLWNRALTAGEVRLLTDDPPAFASSIGSKSVNEGALLQFVIPAATDPNGDTLAYFAESLPPGSSFDAGQRSFTWMPDYSQSGTYRVCFGVTDGTATVRQEIVITVNEATTDADTTGAGPAADLSHVMAYPNPYNPGRAQAQAQTKIFFSRLTAGMLYFRIFTVSGQLVKEWNEETATGRVSWAPVNSRGEKLSSGVYFYAIQNDRGQKAKGKIVIIR